MDGISLSKRERALPRSQYQEFYEAVVGGSTDIELANRFALRERTAYNYRRRAEEEARRNGVVILKRNKGPATSNDRPLETHPEG